MTNAYDARVVFADTYVRSLTVLRLVMVGWLLDKNLDDKEAAEIKFKEIGEVCAYVMDAKTMQGNSSMRVLCEYTQAYSVLSDEDKRRQYDRFGKNAVNGSAGGGHGHGGMHGFHGQDAEEIFRTFFGGQDPFSMFFQEGMHGGMQNNFGGSRVHVSQFGPGFTFTTFGNAPGMRQQRVPHQRRRYVHALV